MEAVVIVALEAAIGPGCPLTAVEAGVLTGVRKTLPRQEGNDDG